MLLITRVSYGNFLGYGNYLNLVFYDTIDEDLNCA